MLNKYIVTSSIKRCVSRKSQSGQNTWLRSIWIEWHKSNEILLYTDIYEIDCINNSLQKYPSWCWQWLESFIGWLLTFLIQSTHTLKLNRCIQDNTSLEREKKHNHTHIKMKRTHEKDVPNTCYYWKRWIRFVF